MMTYWIIFISAFGAATVLPFYSEIAVVAAIQNNFNPWFVWGAASLGNTLGSILNWLLGMYLERFKHRRWFPFKPAQLSKAQAWFNRYGVWSLLLAWLPIGGDALTLIAGVMRVRFWLFIVLVAIGKSIRYGLVIGTMLYFS